MTQHDVPVEISEGLRKNPSLLRAVEQATEYFLASHQDLPSDIEWRDARLKWIESPGIPGSVRPIFQEEHPDQVAIGNTVHFVDIPRSQMMDDYGRGVGVRRLLRSVIQGRAKVLSERIDRWLIEMEREEVGHA